MAVVKKKQVSKRWTRLKNDYDGTFYVLYLVLDGDTYAIAQVKRESAFSSAAPWFIDYIGDEYVTRDNVGVPSEYLTYPTLKAAKEAVERIFEEFIRSKK